LALIGYICFNLLEKNGLINIVLSIISCFVSLLGGIFLISGAIKFKKERGDVRKPLGEERNEIKKQSRVEKYIFPIIAFAISLLIFYWFEIRPQQIRLKCFKETPWNTEKGKIYQECLERHGIKE